MAAGQFDSRGGERRL